MIPFAILSCTIVIEQAASYEVRILELSKESFTFRLSYHYLCKPKKFVLRFYSYAEAGYRTLELTSFSIESETDTNWINYQVYTNQSDFAAYTEDLQKEYMQYIILKQAGDDAALSEALTGYPAAEEERFSSHFLQQKREWFEKLVSDDAWYSTIKAVKKIFFTLDNFEGYNDYLSRNYADFVNFYWKSNELQHHPISQLPLNGICIGNAYCIHLFPNTKLLLQLLEKARLDGLSVKIVFPCIRESDFLWLENMIQMLAAWCGEERKLELVCNDWGMLSCLKKRADTCFSITLGTLLQKRRKDVRLHYKNGIQHHLSMLRENAADAGFYRKWLRDTLAVAKLSYESCGYSIRIEKGSTLYLPFYQMTTAGYCTLYAMCHNGSRGRQTEENDCPQYCREFCFLYPKTLHMIGRYNSLFGFDKQILEDGAYLKGYLEQGIEELIFNLL